MNHIAVVYWTGTGNTKIMADALVEGAKGAGAEVDVFTSADFDASMLGTYDAFAFGCPSMGEEVLEEEEFDPMFTACKAGLAGKKVALFGSYGWGDGEWMRTWESDCKDAGIQLVADGVICNEVPDADGKALCKALGKAVAEA